MKRLDKMKKQANLKCENFNLTSIQNSIDLNTDLKSLLNLDTDEKANVSIIGLHSCGNLSNFLIDLYLSQGKSENEKVRRNLLFYVTCCYHLISEKYAPWEWDYIPKAYGRENESDNDEENTIKDEFKTFPMSSYLNRKQYTLGRNARMLSSQPLERLLANNQVR